MAASTPQRLLERDLAAAPFQMGVTSGKWRLAQPVDESTWPMVFTHVQAAKREGSSAEMLVRWDLAGYGEQSPTGAFWDAATSDYLATAKWPKGRVGSTVEAVFKVSQWVAPGRGFYHPYDRQANNGHVQWPTADPQHVWNKNNTITDFLHLVHRWLNCEAYLGC